MFQTLDRWAVDGGTIPFTWAELRAHTGAAAASVDVGAQALLLAKTALGTVWPKFFGPTDPLETDVVPGQLAKALHRQLVNLKDKFKDRELEAQADTAFGAIRERHKRARVSLAS